MAAENTPDSPHLHLFEALFGRDALRVAELLDRRYPRLTLGTVLRLAEVQGVAYDTAREEEPGRVPHEVRSADDPVAVRISAEEGWAWPYYGSIDATPLWIRAVVRCARRNARVLETAVVGRDGRARTVATCAAAATAWLCRRLDDSPVGLLESRPAFSGAIEHQVWKDSWDAYSHADGAIARVGTIASVEAQALAFDALSDAADLYRFAPLAAMAFAAEGVPPPQDLLAIAGRIRDTVTQRLWVDEANGPGSAWIHRRLSGWAVELQREVPSDQGG